MKKGEENSASSIGKWRRKMKERAAENGISGRQHRNESGSRKAKAQNIQQRKIMALAENNNEVALIKRSVSV
jgi:hypothetical protein